MNRLSEMAGLSQQMVSYVERGLRMPTLETLLRMTSALGINLGRVIDKAIAAGGEPKRPGEPRR